VNNLNFGDNFEYPKKLEMGCCVQDLPPFLRAIGSSRSLGLFSSCSTPFGTSTSLEFLFYGLTTGGSDGLIC